MANLINARGLRFPLHWSFCPGADPALLNTDGNSAVMPEAEFAAGIKPHRSRALSPKPGPGCGM